MSSSVDAPPEGGSFMARVQGELEGCLVIPQDYKKKFLTPLPRHVTLSTADGKLWIVAILVYKGTAYLASGWKTFRDEYALAQGDHVVFTFDGDSHFNVQIFLKNGMERDFSADSVQLGNDAYTHRPKKRKSSCRCEGNLRIQRNNLVEEENEAIVSSIVSKSMVDVQGFEHPLNNEDYIEMGEEELNKRYGDHVPYCHFIVEEATFRAPFEMVVDARSLIFVKFSRVIVRHKDDETSYFYIQNIPTDFARAELSPGLTAMKLKHNGHGHWPIVCCMDGNKAHIMEGWREFVKENDVHMYDEISFERNRVDNSVWNVTILRSTEK